VFACEMLRCDLIVRIVLGSGVCGGGNPLISTGALGSGEVQHFQYKRCCPNPLVSIGGRS